MCLFGGFGRSWANAVIFGCALDYQLASVTTQQVDDTRGSSLHPVQRTSVTVSALGQTTATPIQKHEQPDMPDPLEGQQHSPTSRLMRRDPGKGSHARKSKRHEGQVDNDRIASDAHNETTTSDAQSVRDSSPIAQIARDAHNASSSDLGGVRGLAPSAQKSSLSLSAALSTLRLKLDAFRSKLTEVSTSMLLVVTLCFLLGLGLTLLWVKPESLRAATSSVDPIGFLRSASRRLIEEVPVGNLPDATSQNPTTWDFEVVDDRACWQTRFFKWCSIEEAAVLGVLVQAPTRPYLEHVRIDVEAKAKDVGELMDCGNVDLGTFSNMDDLLWKLLRAECYFMALPDHTSVLLMVETVRLRCFSGGRLLIQESDSSFLHSLSGLPGIEKATGRSPVAASKDLWTAGLNMPESVADFIEDVVEDVEFEGFRGLRCVERAHIMIVNLRSQDPEVVDRIGLSDHCDFSVTDRQGASINFKWMTPEQCLQIGGPLLTVAGACLTNLDATACQRRSSLVSGSIVSGNSQLLKLAGFLRQEGIDPDTWDSNREEFQSLVTELKTGKCYLEKNSTQVMRVVNHVAVRVWSPDTQLLLLERGRRNELGEQEWDAQLPSQEVAAAMCTITENIREVTMALCETMRLREDDVNFLDEVTWEYHEYVEALSRFKGLATKHQTFFVDAILNTDEDLYLRMGLAGRIVITSAEADLG